MEESIEPMHAFPKRREVLRPRKAKTYKAVADLAIHRLSYEAGLANRSVTFPPFCTYVSLQPCQTDLSPASPTHSSVCESPIRLSHHMARDGSHAVYRDVSARQPSRSSGPFSNGVAAGFYFCLCACIATRASDDPRPAEKPARFIHGSCLLATPYGL